MPNRIQQIARVAATPILVAVAVWCAWWFTLGAEGARRVVAEHWPVSLTMVFGSFVAGVSSEGGGAVAFPVFTKLLAVRPSDAKLFALLIQSVGMTAAAIGILVMRVRVDWRAVGWASLGGAVGVAISLANIAPYAPPMHVRVLFTALQAGFAVALVAQMRRPHKRVVLSRMRGWRGAAVLVWIGLIGGSASGLMGSGIDLVFFAVMTLLFRVCEKVATPSSVVVMAINSVVATGFYLAAIGPIPTGVAQMWLAAVPVVVIGAPVGAWVCSRLSRVTIAWCLVGLIGVEVASTAILAPMDWQLASLAGGAWLLCCVGCFFMAQRRTFDPTTLRRKRKIRRRLDDRSAEPVLPVTPTPVVRTSP